MPPRPSSSMTSYLPMHLISGAVTESKPCAYSKVKGDCTLRTQCRTCYKSNPSDKFTTTVQTRTATIPRQQSGRTTGPVHVELVPQEFLSLITLRRRRIGSGIQVQYVRFGRSIGI